MALCKFEPCLIEGKGGGRGFCEKCGQKYRRGTLPGWEIPEEERCVAPSCKALGHKEGQHCFKHYKEWLRNGKDPNYWESRQILRTCRQEECIKKIRFNSHGLCGDCADEAQHASLHPSEIPTKHIKFETECKVDGCEKEVAGNGFCISDWRRWKRGHLEGFNENGDPIAAQSHSR